MAGVDITDVRPNENSFAEGNPPVELRAPPLGHDAPRLLGIAHQNGFQTFASYNVTIEIDCLYSGSRDERVVGHCVANLPP